MILSFPFTPEPGELRVDWAEIDRSFAWVREMAGCMQDSSHHAEGDVWIHTRMVCESMIADGAWKALTSSERQILFAAALLHDVAKPRCTRSEDGRITSRGHSRRGEIMAREILWRMRLPFGMREQVAALVRFHQIPFFLVDRADTRPTAIRISQSARCDYLAMVAKADAMGRICGDKNRLLDNIALFVEFCREQGCLSTARAFRSDHSRFQYFRSEGRDPDYLAYDDTRCEVVMMSGLPGSGKDRWIAEHIPDWPKVSLDDLRREMGIAPTENQGRLISLAREKARQHLRERRSFVWNATNVSSQVRAQSIDLFANYNARVRIVYVESLPETLYRQNRERDGRVPETVISKLLDRWEVPRITEAHQVEWIVEE